MYVYTLCTCSSASGLCILPIECNHVAQVLYMMSCLVVYTLCCSLSAGFNCLRFGLQRSQGRPFNGCEPTGCGCNGVSLSVTLTVVLTVCPEVVKGGQQMSYLYILLKLASILIHLINTSHC